MHHTNGSIPSFTIPFLEMIHFLACFLKVTGLGKAELSSWFATYLGQSGVDKICQSYGITSFDLAKPYRDQQIF